MQNLESLVKLEIKVSLPRPLVREAEAGGLLTADAIEAMLRKELRRRRVDELFHAADKLADVPLPPLTAEEIDKEIAATRRARRAADASGRWTLFQEA